MNIIITKLSEIDKAASKIIDDAAAKKSNMEKVNDDKIEAYDKELEEQNNIKINQMKDEFEKKLKVELKEIKQQADSVSQEMEQYYDENHDALSDRIIQDIIGK